MKQRIAILAIMLTVTLGLVAGPASGAVQPADDCTLDVHIRGGGAVIVQRANGEETLLDMTPNALSLSCGERVTLAAEAESRWLFTGWAADGSATESLLALTAGETAAVTATFELQGVSYVDVPGQVLYRGQWVDAIPQLDQSWQDPTAATMTPDAVDAAPSIAVWYGTTQPFGQQGNPQKWVNILGKASDADGNLSSLSFTLNGGAAQTLSIGPDGRRLQNQGDFNVEIDRRDLQNGANTVVITARDTTGNATTETVTINYAGGNVWPLPDTTSWPGGAQSQIQTVAQVVDGNWIVQSGRLRPNEWGYDRVVAIGDVAWRDYEVTVPITVHALDPAGYNPVSVGPGVGINIHWTGHTNRPVTCGQPHCGWLPVGTAAWYDFKKEQFFTYPEGDTSGKKLDLKQTYIWKVRAETNEQGESVYKFKVWQEGQSEPGDWLITSPGESGTAHSEVGSLLLNAHHVDATFGTVTVTPLNGGGGDTEAPVVSDVRVVPGLNQATFTWKTDEPATSQVQIIGGESESSSNLVQDHVITVGGLSRDRQYSYQLTSIDAAGNSTTTQVLNFRTVADVSPESDDFNSCGTLDGRWSFINPLNDGTYRADGEAVRLTVPSGAGHLMQQSVRTAPRIMQSTQDVSFEIETKFDSAVSANEQFQGLLVEQDNKHFVRVEYRYDDGLRIYATTVTEDQGERTRVNWPVTYEPPLYLRLTRAGDEWTISHSNDGASWNSLTAFTQAIQVNSAGVYAGNRSPGGAVPAPKHEAIVDYFFNTGAPIDPEDSESYSFDLALAVEGQGEVQLSKQGPYSCGDEVTLTANPTNGWLFAGWQGDLSGTGNPKKLTMTDDKSVTARFRQEGVAPPPVYVPLITR